jgi:hypothetical protein
MRNSLVDHMALRSLRVRGYCVPVCAEGGFDFLVAPESLLPCRAVCLTVVPASDEHICHSCAALLFLFFLGPCAASVVTNPALASIGGIGFINCCKFDLSMW